MGWQEEGIGGKGILRCIKILGTTLGKKYWEKKRKYGESTLRSCDFFLQQILNSRKNYSFSLHSRIKFHVTLYNNPEQFLN